MPRMVPRASDFPPSLQPIIHQPTHPSSSTSVLRSQPSNVMIFLPGLGDTAINFSSFAKALNLPDTITITVNPPYPLPFPIGPGQHWSDDLQIDTETGTLDPIESGFSKATELVAQRMIRDVLIDEYGWRAQEIHLFGFGQGGSLALALLLHPALSASMSSGLGGVVSIGGPLPLSTPTVAPTSTSTSTSTPTPTPSTSDPPSFLSGDGTAATETSRGKNKTPLLLLGRPQGELFRDGGVNDSSRIKRIRDRFEFVEVHCWKSAGNRAAPDSMPRNRDEVLPLMQFWGRRLRSRRGVPADAVEVK